MRHRTFIHCDSLIETMCANHTLYEAFCDVSVLSHVLAVCAFDLPFNFLQESHAFLSVVASLSSVTTDARTYFAAFTCFMDRAWPLSVTWTSTLSPALKALSSFVVLSTCTRTS